MSVTGLGLSQGMCREQLSRGFKTSKGLRREDDKSGDEAAVLPMAHARPMPAGAPGGLAALLSTCWGSCLGAGELGGGAHRELPLLPSLHS